MNYTELKKLSENYDLAITKARDMSFDDVYVVEVVVYEKNFLYEKFVKRMRFVAHESEIDKIMELKSN